MNRALQIAREQANLTRYRLGQSAGHYESFFQRANHPTRPLAFWIRYTLFSPAKRPADAVGELWAIYFDGERTQHVAVKSVVPFSQCEFSQSNFSVAVADARLDADHLAGTAASGGHAIAWDLTYRGDAPPLFLLPLRLYRASLPRAKSLVGLPLATYDGVLTVDGKAIAVDGWVGSQNHNWGSRHTDQYAWGQVAGFDAHPDSFLEVATARLRIGPFWTPRMTPIVVRHRGREFRLNRLGQTLRTTASLRDFHWSFVAESNEVRLEGAIEGARANFVGLRYDNPPGGAKICLNSKIAACELQLTTRDSGARETLVTRQRAAFEILTDDTTHGIDVRA
jgi:hypothetical protein